MKKNKELTTCSKCGRRNWHEHRRCSWCNGLVQTHAEKFMGHVMGLIVIVAMLVLAWRLAQ